MKAVVVDQQHRLALQDVTAPNPARNEALVRVAAISLNRGEVRRAKSVMPAGARPGWDAAGTVEKAAADGSGPKEGARVVGVLGGMRAWGEQAAIPTNMLAALPDNVSFAQAACLPVAGLTALHALDRRGSVLGRKVLITGATGGVGHFACRLAQLGGAHVVAAVRNEADVALVRGYGAHEVAVIGADAGRAAALGPYDLIVESIGGASLAASLSMLNPDGLISFIGNTEGAETKVDASKFFWTGAAQVYGLILFRDLQMKESGTVGLNRLLSFVARGLLKPDVALEKPWTEIDAVAQMLLDRSYRGKAVLRVG